MATVVCSVCGKENVPTGNWNYCRGCGGRLALPVAQTTVRAAAGGNEAVTATAAPPATARHKPAEPAPRRTQPSSKLPKKTKQELAKEQFPWTAGLIVVGAALGMIIGSLVREQGIDYGLVNDPFNIGLVGGIVTGGLIAQLMLWYRQSQQ